MSKEADPHRPETTPNQEEPTVLLSPIESNFGKSLKHTYGKQSNPDVDLRAESGESVERLRKTAESQQRYEIGRGGMGAGLKVFEADLRHNLAMKVVLGRGGGADGDSKSLDPQQLLRFLEEAQVRPWIRSGLYIATCIAGSTGVIALIEHWSATPRPSATIRFGGSWIHLDPFQAPPAGRPMGHCLPGVHLAGAFAFMGSDYSLRQRFTRHRWTAIIAWIQCTGLYGMIFGGHLSRSPL